MEKKKKRWKVNKNSKRRIKGEGKGKQGIYDVHCIGEKEEKREICVTEMYVPLGDVFSLN